MSSFAPRVNTAQKESPAVDAFARMRISNPVTIFDSQSQYDTVPLLWTGRTASGGAATHEAAESGVTLATTSTIGSLAVRQTRQYLRYQPGKSQLVLVTFTCTDVGAGQRFRAGYFDDSNGIYFQKLGDAVSVGIRSQSSNGAQSVAQASWNLDKLDGTGPSGIDFDFTKSAILVIDFEWLGVGQVRIGFAVDSSIYYVHQFKHAGNISGVYMTTGNLPVRYELENVSADAGGEALAICCSVISEGGVETERAYRFSQSTAATSRSAPDSTSYLPLIAIRPAATFNSITNRSQIQMEDFGVYATGNPAHVVALYDPTLTGGAWSAANASSAVEYNITATAVSGGLKLDEFYVPVAGTASAARSAQGSRLSIRLPFCLDIDGANPNVIVIAARGLGGAALCYPSIEWTEVR